MSSGYPQLDSSKATSWVYPKSDSFAIRDYQVDICKHALFLNTLVCLPTGLGKTLIAAVVMYNYYRWFPTGKVIFLAPTKPLVNQQINACHDIMGIPEEDIAHLEGSVVAAKRETLWTEKRVFFCTPQTLMNDLTNGRCNPKSIVCIVIDEAHRATGQYAYTTAIQEISMHSANFRVLALSATPGSDARKVQAVISNLLISHIELRSEDDPELQPYTHQRQIDIVVCEQGAYNGIQAVRKLLNDLMERHVNKLSEFGIVQCDSVNQLNFLHVQESEDAMRTAWVDGVYDAEVLHELNTAVDEMAALLRCRKALCDEGLKALLELLNSMKTHHLECVSRGSVQASHSIVSTELFARTVDLLHRAVLDPKYLEKRQPKLNKLKEILSDHFGRHGRAGSSTRALVFSQLRSTVHEIKTEISDVPGIKAHEFVGQGTAKSTSTYTDTDPDYSNKGLTQADQARILQSFNAGQYNVLVATSIAEEGLDIAEVDLIVLFESVASPIRLVQRCGRTGRKRSGKVVMLVSQGQEETKVEKSHDNASEIAKTLRHASKNMHMYAHNPVMFPPHRPLPSMVLQDMCVQVFRPSEVAGGMSRNTKSNGNSSSTSNNNANNSRNNAHNSHNTGNKGTKPGYSMSAYLGGSTNRSTGYNGQSNSSNSGDKLMTLNDVDSPEWIPTHSRTNTSTSNHNNNNRMSLSNMLGATSHSNKTSEPPPQQGFDNYANTCEGNDEWGFDQNESYDTMRDASSSHSNSRNGHNYAVQTSSSNDVHRHCNITSNAHNNNQHSYGSSYHDSSTVNDDAALYGWGADVPSSTAMNSNHYNSMKDKPVPVESTSYTTNTNNWTSVNKNSCTVQKAIEVVDLLDSPLVKSNKRPASLLLSNCAVTTATAYRNVSSAGTLPTAAAAPSISITTSSVITDRVPAQRTAGTIVATTSTSAPTSTSTVNTASLPANNLVPRTVFKPNVSSVPNNRNASFGGIRLTNIVRSTNRNISFVALDDDLSFSSADEATAPAPLKQNVNCSVATAALCLPASSNSGRGTTSTLYKPSCMSVADSKSVNVSRAPLHSSKGSVNEDVEGLSDTQSESENKQYGHGVRKNKSSICESVPGKSSASVPNVNNGTVESAPLPPPRSQYVDNSGIDWGSSSSGSSSGESQEPEMVNQTLYMEPLDDIDSEMKKRRKVPRIQETQECFFSQCSISEEEGDKREENQASTLNSTVGVEQRQVSALQDLREPQVNAAHSRTGTGTNKTDANEDSGCESAGSDASDTANACCACLDHVSYEHDVIVFCEGLCGACIHVSCYGVLYNGVPEGDFYCEGCTYTLGITNTSNSSVARADKRKAKKESHRRSSKATCALCFRSGGLMTLSTTDTFVHPICVLFTPELTFCPETSRANNVASLDKDRKYIKCEVCQEIGGAVVQCAETCCLKAAHPFCAYEARRQMVVRVHNAEDGSQGHQAAGLAFTQHHTQNIHHKQNQENCDGGQFNTYELYCAKHKSLPSRQKERGSIIATSRLPLRDPSFTSQDAKNVKNRNSKGQDKKNKKHSNRHSIGIADQETYTSDDSTDDMRTAAKKRKAVQFVVKKGGAHEKKSGESNASSPGDDLVDTAEKPPRDLKKKRNSASRESVDDGRKAKHKHKRRRTDPAVARFFELEAVLSGSDSGNDEGISEDGEGQDSDASGSSESTQLSGNFINDGTYTQHSPQGGATQYGMYLAVNNYHSHMRSPDDFVRGKLNVAGLVRRKPLLQSPSDLQDTQASDASPNSSIVDTPQGTPDQQQGQRDRWKSASWLDSGTQQGASDGTASSDGNSSDGDDDMSDIESELDSARKNSKNAGPKKGDLRDQNRLHVPQKSSLMAQLSKKPTRDGAHDKNITKSKAVSKNFALSREKENSSTNTAIPAPSRTKSTFFNKLALRGLQDNSSDDSDQDTKKTKRSHKISAAHAASVSSASVSVKHTAKGLTTNSMAVAVDLTSSPMCPVSPSRSNNLGPVHHSKVVPAAPTSPFGWGF